MRRRSQTLLGIAILVIVVVPAAVFIGVLPGRYRETRRSLDEVCRLPFTTAIETTPTEVIRAGRRIYNHSGYGGVVDIGDIRLTVHGWRFGGESQDSIVIDTGQPEESVVLAAANRGTALFPGLEPPGEGGFTTISDETSTGMRFAELELTIAGSRLYLDGREIPLGQGRRVVVVTRQGRIEQVIPIWV